MQIFFIIAQSCIKTIYSQKEYLPTFPKALLISSSSLLCLKSKKSASMTPEASLSPSFSSTVPVCTCSQEGQICSEYHGMLIPDMMMLIKRHRYLYKIISFSEIFMDFIKKKTIVKYAISHLLKKKCFNHYVDTSAGVRR